jgi:hypothetical protein
MPDKLHRLPDGTWIALADVHGIRPCPSMHGFLPTVVVQIGDNQATVPFETYTNAVEYADRLAALVNDAWARETSNG